MSDPMPDRWHSIDLPSLKIIMRLMDEYPGRIWTVEQITTYAPSDGFNLVNNTTMSGAMTALARGGYVVVEQVGRRVGGTQPAIVDITEKAYRATGAWPSPEAVTDRLLAALGNLAEYSENPVERSAAKKALDGLGTFSRDTLVSVAGAAAGVAMQQ